MAAPLSITGFKVAQDRFRELADFSRGRVAMHKRMSVAWHAAGQAFVRVAVRAALIETGMTAASFLPLARTVKKVEGFVYKKLAKRKAFKPGIPELPSGKRSDGVQGVRAGNTRGAKAYVFTTGTPSRFLFRFSFQTTVFQHAFHEATGKSNTLVPGANAFVGVIQKKFPLIARDILNDFFRGKKIRDRQPGDGFIGPIQTLNVGGL